MDKPATATVAIPDDVIKPIVQARVQAAIVEALGKQGDLVSAAVAAALTQKVNDKGEVDGRYSYDNKYTFLEVMTNKYIREAAHEALKEHLEKAKAGIKEKVRRELEKKSSVLAAALVDGFARSIETTYGFKLDVHLKELDR